MPINPASRSIPNDAPSTSASVQSHTTAAQTSRSSIEPASALVSPTFDLKLYALQLKKHSLDITGEAIDSKLKIESSTPAPRTLKLAYDANISEADNLQKLETASAFIDHMANQQVETIATITSKDKKR